LTPTSPWVFCGARRLELERADHFEPPARLTPPRDFDRILDDALAAPVAAGRLAELARGAATVALAVPDGSRPCPSGVVVRHLLDELRRASIPREAVTVVVGCGLHATTSVEEKRALLSPLADEPLRVVDAQGLESPLADLGVAACGAPVSVDRRVADADLVVTVGVVEPHLYAGFSGGVKGVAIGCAGAETVAWTHRPAFIARPGVELGVLEGNPFASALEEIAAFTPLRFAVNVVVDEAGSPADVAAGAPRAVQHRLAGAHRAAWLRPVPGPFDVAVCGVARPKSASYYQASRAATYLALTARPALAPGGLIVLCADLPDGPGTGPGEANFAALLAAASSPAELVARGLNEPLGPGGQRAWVVARVLERYRIAVAGAADPRALEGLGGDCFATVAEAVAAHERRLGRRARVLAVADATATVVRAA
jgi:nickel-dependent lactate racemase